MPRTRAKMTTKPYVRPRSSPSPSDNVDGIRLNSHSGIKMPKNKNKNKNKYKSMTSQGKTQNPAKRPAGEQRGEHDPIVAKSDTDNVTLPVVKPTISEPPTKRAPKSPKTWTNDEYVLVFAHVAAHVRLAGETLFEGVVPGRPESETYNMWKTTIEPHIRTMLALSGKTVETKVIEDRRAERETRTRGKMSKRTKEAKRKVTNKHNRGQTDKHDNGKTDKRTIAPGGHRVMYVGDDDTVNEDVDELDSNSD